MKRRTGSDRGSGSGSIPTWKPCSTSLFVYGTLMSGFRAHGLLLNLQASSPQVAFLPHHDLYHFDPGDYPLIYPGRGRVKGEVWSLPLEALLILDIYEGVQEGIYERVLSPVETPRGEVMAWVYRATPQAMRDLRDRLRKVSGGDWRVWKRGTTF